MIESSFTTYCTFWVGNGLFGTEASLVKEVAVLPFMTPIPQAADAVRGYVNLRGQIVLVVDLKCILLQRATPIGNDTRLVVFRSCLGDPFGILVDRIGDIVELHDDRIEKCDTGTYTTGGEKRTPPEEELISGIGKLADELLSILDARKLLPIIDKAIAECRATSLNRE
jgi:purine-binding chemotaxis protein CheW